MTTSPDRLYERYFKVDQQKNAQALADLLLFPHVRVVGSKPGRIEYFESEQDFIRRTSWDERVETGWVKTEGSAAIMLKLSKEKIHVAGGWSRRNLEGESILKNRVAYVFRKVDKSWKIQARFACGATKEWETTDQADTKWVVGQFTETLTEGNFQKLEEFISFPFTFVGLHSIEIFNEMSELKMNSECLSIGLCRDIEPTSLLNNSKASCVFVELEQHLGRHRDLLCLVSMINSTPKVIAMSLV